MSDSVLSTALDSPKSGTGRRRRKKLTAMVSSNQSITFYGPELEFDTCVEMLETLLKQAKSARSEQMRLSTFLLVLKDRHSAESK